MNLRNGILFKDLYGSCFGETVSKDKADIEETKLEKEEAPRWSIFEDIFTKQEIDLLIDHSYARTLEFDIIKENAHEKEPIEMTEVTEIECNNNIDTTFDNENESILKAYLLNLNMKGGLHIINLENENDIRCIVCNETFKDQELLTRHLETHNDKSKLSEEKIPSASHLHSKQIFSCNQCDKDFKQVKYFNQHVKTVHCMEKPFKCWHCDESFVSYYYLGKHVKGSHNEKYQETKKIKRKTFKCEFCSKAFLFNYELIRHLVSHGPKQFKCEMCDKEFAYERSLKTHLLRHSEKKVELKNSEKKIVNRKRGGRKRKKELSVEEKLKALKQFLGE